MINMYVINEWLLAKILGWGTGMDLDEFLDEYPLETVEEYIARKV